MATGSKYRFLVLVICLLAAGISTTKLVRSSRVEAASSRPQADDSAQESRPSTAQSDQDSQAEAGEEELAPAAVALDLSSASPLIQELYQATRETKEQAILARIAHAKELVKSADVKATDAQGRTALHWAIFGSSYTTKPKVLVAYEGIADTLIEREVELNREDIYHDTALDYLLYSPNFEMQTLLIEHGASSGFFAAFFNFFNEMGTGVPATHATAIAMSRQADLVPGQTLSVRLDQAVYSDRSRTGDPIAATVTYPLCKSGEQIACDPGELLIAPGTKVNGTILFASKAPDKYSRARIVLDFSNIVHKNGLSSPLYARVLSVDNAREAVQNSEILGIIQPHASNKLSIATAALGAANPIAGYTLKGVQTVYGLSIRREIHFPAGTDLQLQVVRPSMLKQKDTWSGWPQLPMTDQLHQIVAAVPMRAHTGKDTPSDLVNLMFLGSKEEVIAAFGEAGWFQADDLGISSALKTAQATLRQTGYASAPVSLLLMNGQPPDLVFQKSLDTFARRHHIRIWKTAKKYDGREVWVAAATHDIATASARANTKWSHRIDPHIDRERHWVETDLLFIGTAVSFAAVDRPSAPRKTSNATGDEILTDGKISIVELAKRAPSDKAILTPRQ